MESALPPGRPTSDERQLAMLAHLLTFVGGFIAPLVILLVQQGKSAYVVRQAKESLNYQITSFLISLVGLATICIGVGFVILIAIGMLNVVLVILAAIATNRGDDHRYPFALRLIT